MSLYDNIHIIKQVAETLPDDDPDKVEMMNVEGDYSALIDWAIRKRNEVLTSADANKELSKLYKDRQTRFENKADKLKDIVTDIMNSAKETSYKGDYGTVTIRDVKPKPIITDEDKVPMDYKKAFVDKTAINKAVKDGLQIEGVSMDNGGVTTTIRSK